MLHIITIIRLEGATIAIKREMYSLQVSVLERMEDNEAFLALDNFLGAVFNSEDGDTNYPTKKVER